MASVIKYPSGRYWIAAFRDASGRQHRRTTREIDKKRAQAVAGKFEMAAKSKGSPQRVRQIFSEFYRDHYGEELPFASVRKYALEWLATRKAETSPATHRRYGEAVQKFLSFSVLMQTKALKKSPGTQIAAFRDTRIQESAVHTANSDLKIVRAIFQAEKRGGSCDSQRASSRIRTREKAAALSLGLGPLSGSPGACRRE